MIGESGLAGVNRRLELRNASLLLGVYVVAGLVAAAAVAALSVSYARNRDFLEQVGAAIGVFEQTAQVEPKSPLNAIVARLDAIRGVVDLADRYRETTSMPMRWGLYEGRSISNSARDAYVRELDSILLPRFAMQLQARVIEYAGDPQKLYPVLQGLLDARGPVASGQGVPRDARRSRVEAGRWRRRRGRARACAAFLGAARECNDVASAAARRNTGQPGAQQPAAGLAPADSLRRNQARLRRRGRAGAARRSAHRARSGKGIPAEERRASLGADADAVHARAVRRHHDGRPRRDSQGPDEGCLDLGAEQCVVARQRGSAVVGSHRSLRDRLHPRLGRVHRRPAVCSGHHSRADQRRVPDPDVADLAADRPAQCHRRADDARAGTGRGRRERRDQQGDAGARRHHQSSAKGPRPRNGRAGDARNSAFPVGAATPGWRGGKEADRRHPQFDPRDTEAARHARSRCSRRQPDPDAAGSVVPRADADASSPGDVAAACRRQNRVADRRRTRRRRDLGCDDCHSDVCTTSRSCRPATA